MVSLSGIYWGDLQAPLSAYPCSENPPKTRAQKPDNGGDQVSENKVFELIFETLRSRDQL